MERTHNGIGERTPSEHTSSRSGDRTLAGRGERPRLAYVPGLDGLRALAVAAVLLYHHDPRLLPGGFLGVELFFVLSGYLITALLFFEWRAFGRVDLAGFWLRRARRLLPALVVLVLACLAVGALFLPAQLAQLRGDALAALLYVANWRLILDERPYFALFERPSLLLHLWSLAIEEQFYLLWPPLLVFALNRLRPRGTLALTLVLTLVSTALMALLARPDGDMSRVYYGTDTRAAGLLLGAALALGWPPRTLRTLTRRRAAPWRDLLGLAALAALAAIFATVHEFTPWLYRGGFLLVGLAAAGAIAAVARPGAHLCRAVLGLAPWRWLGERSYGIYLWHWPVFALARPGLDVPLDSAPLLAARLAATLVLAELSYTLVELPVRRGALGRAWRALHSARGPRRTWLALRWLAGGGAALALVAWIGVAAAGAPPASPAPGWAAALPPGAELDARGAAALPTSLVASAASEQAQPLSPRLALPTVPPATATPAPPPLPVTPIAGAARPPVDLAAITHEPLTPALAAPAPGRTRDPRVAPAPAPPVPAPAPGPAGSVLAIGDSIMLGASGALREALPGVEIDAAVSRQIGAVIELARARRDTGALADVVVVHVGNNGYVSPERAAELLEALAGVPRVVVVNTAVPRSWEGPNNAGLAAAVAAAPNAVLVDWQAASTGRYELFWNDGVHLRPEGARVFAELIAQGAGR